jgi:hypothetical protein
LAKTRLALIKAQQQERNKKRPILINLISESIETEKIARLVDDESAAHYPCPFVCPPASLGITF